MPTYKEKIAPSIDRIRKLSDTLNLSNNEMAHEIRWELLEIEDMMDNPFQTIPTKHFVHVTASLCDPEGNSDKSYSDVLIDFDREVSESMLYLKIEEYMGHYALEYTPQVSLGDLEDWLNQQKSHYLSVEKNDLGFIEDTGLTVGKFKTSYGSIDFFIEYALVFEGV